MLNPLEGIDYDLLNEQKYRLLNLDTSSMYKEEIDAISGIIILIDNIQDYAVEELCYDENYVFGKQLNK